MRKIAFALYLGLFLTIMWYMIFVTAARAQSKPKITYIVQGQCITWGIDPFTVGGALLKVRNNNEYLLIPIEYKTGTYCDNAGDDITHARLFDKYVIQAYYDVENHRYIARSESFLLHGSYLPEVSQ